MHENLARLDFIKNKIKEIVDKKQLKTAPEIIAISKTFPLEKIIPLLDRGHIHFGENKIQEAELKWNGVTNKYKEIKLHMVGKLQSNKAKKAVEIFDYIHSLDNEKLAVKLQESEKKVNKKIKYFIQVNVANEKQKSGILLSDLESFYSFCTKNLSLDIVGLMCFPPFNSNSEKYFEIIKISASKLNLKHISMGMSNDYEIALFSGSTFLRLGSAIFGSRKLPN